MWAVKRSRTSLSPPRAPEQLLGSNFAFRTEQAAVSVLSNLGLYADVGSETVSNLAIAASTPPAPVASVTVSPATTSGQVGGTVQLAAVTKDSAGNPLTGRSVTWASSAPGLAIVSATGRVTGVAAGAATITAMSEGKSGTAALTVAAASCLTSAGAWQNSAVASQTGTFEAQFDATPATASTNAAVGLSNGPAAAYTALATIVAFEQTGVIDARNGGAYAAATAIPYSVGTTYHFRLDVNIPTHTYDIYVTPAGATEQLVGKGFAFRTEQAAVSVLNNLGVDANVGSATVCNPGVSAWTPPARAPVASVAVSPATASPQVGQTAQLSATPKDSAGAAVDGRAGKRERGRSRTGGRRRQAR